LQNSADQRSVLSGCFNITNFSIVLEMRCYDKLVGVKKQT